MLDLFVMRLISCKTLGSTATEMRLVFASFATAEFISCQGVGFTGSVIHTNYTQPNKNLDNLRDFPNGALLFRRCLL